MSTARHLSSRQEALDGRDDMGDPNAPVGSAAWVKAQHFHLCVAKKDVQSRVDNFGSSLMLMRERRWFGELVDSDGMLFSSFEDYCQYPEPWGLGLSPIDVRRILEEPDGAKPVAAVLRARGRPKRGEEKSDAAPLSRGSNGVAYLTARLRRDDPGLADRVERGELTVREAAKRKGWVKKPGLADAWRKASAEERAAFLAEFGDELRAGLTSLPKENQAKLVAEAPAAVSKLGRRLIPPVENVRMSRLGMWIVAGSRLLSEFGDTPQLVIPKAGLNDLQACQELLARVRAEPCVAIPAVPAPQRRFIQVPTPEEKVQHRRRLAVAQVHHCLTSLAWIKDADFWVKELLESEAWKERRSELGHLLPATTLHALVHDAPPVGLGTTYETLEKLIRDNPKVLALLDQVAPAASDDLRRTA